MSFNNLASKFVVLFVCLQFGISSTSCVEIGRGNGAAYPQDTPKSEINSGVQIKGPVHLQGELIFTITNLSAVPVFLLFEPRSDRSDMYFVPYVLECREQRGVFKDYTPSWDAVPARQALGVGDSIRVGVQDFPQNISTCRLSFRYFTDGEAIHLLDRAVSDPDSKRYSDAEEEKISASKNDVSITFALHDAKK